MNTKRIFNIVCFENSKNRKFYKKKKEHEKIIIYFVFYIHHECSQG